MRLFPLLCLAIAACLAGTPVLAATKVMTKSDRAAAKKESAKKSATPAEKDMGDFGSWRAFRVIEKGQHVCYMVARLSGSNADVQAEKSMKGKKAKNKKAAAPAPREAPREAYAMLTFRPAESMAPVFNYNAGALLKEGAETAVAMGKEKFSLFNAGDSAWARTAMIDRDIAAHLSKGGAMQITAVSVKGGSLRDKFDLKGADGAYRKIATACGIPQ
jgi:invasion protein IalB